VLTERMHVDINGIKEFVKSRIKNDLLFSSLPKSESRCVLLTFDDGPNEKITPIVLEKLREFDVEALFFVVGKYVDQNPDLLRQIIEQGHIIGNHTYDHINETRIGFLKYRDQIRRCQNVIFKHTGQKVKLFRPPMGTVRVHYLLATYSESLKTVLWSREGGEWGQFEHETSEEIGARLCKETQPGDVVLLHDNSEKMPTILDIILPRFKEANFNMNSAVASLPK